MDAHFQNRRRISLSYNGKDRHVLYMYSCFIPAAHTVLVTMLRTSVT